MANGKFEILFKGHFKCFVLKHLFKMAHSNKMSQILSNSWNTQRVHLPYLTLLGLAEEIGAKIRKKMREKGHKKKKN